MEKDDISNEENKEEMRKNDISAEVNKEKIKKNDISAEVNKEEMKNDDTLLNDLDETYSKYLIGDLDFLSQSSGDDIDTKMNKMINMIKQGGNIKKITEKKTINIPQKNEAKTRNKSQKSKTKKENENENEKEKEKSDTEDNKEEVKNLTSIDNTTSKKSNTIDEERKNKISIKKMNLRLLKKKEEEYLGIINLQTQIRQNRINKLENQINNQTNKNESIQNGIDVSDTDSSIENEVEPNVKIENGLAFFSHFFDYHILFLKLYFFQALLKKCKKKKRAKFQLEKQRTFTNIKKPRGSKLMRKRKQTTFVAVKDIDKFKKEIRNRSHRLSMNINLFDLKEEKKLDFNDISQIKESKELNEETSRIEINNDEEDTFIQMDRIGDDYKPVDKSQLVEYDLFYKEQFFKNDVFKYDANHIEDKEEKEINREMHKLDVKRRLIEKKKEKEVNSLKGLDTEDLELEIEELEKEYKKAKTIEKPKLDMVMNNTIGLLHKGRMLECYFAGRKEEDFPRFALESEKEIGAKEVIDFKPLRKEEQARRYFDYCICLKERKCIHKCLIYTRFWSRFFIDNWIFNLLSLLVILVNTIIILVSDPNDPKNLGNTSDRYFLFFYTLEAILKIISFTFISAEDAYIKDYWNILDFVVIIAGWVYFSLEILFKDADFGPLVGLRAVRVLRPLRVLKKIKGLKKLATALLASIGHLGETTGILVFVFIIFALAGRQLWQGNFMKRCMNVNYGYVYSTQGSEYMCSFDSDCEELNTYGLRFVCAKGYINPDSGAINFDNILTGFVTIFVMASLEGWTNVFTYASKTFKDKIFINEIIIFIYFHFFIFFCAFYLINLFLAVTNSEFEHIESERKSLIEKKSFFQLIKAKYDLREKEKISKKEKVKKLKENNSKKSNQALIDLYYKIKQEAFHIHKKKRNIPVLYSTVKDMYIMSNDNPEELYLQQLRIEKEEDFLSKDIKRQQKEIDKLIKAKKEEMKKSPKDRAEEEKTLMLIKTSTQQTRTNNSNNNNINNNTNVNNIGTIVKHNFKRTFSNYSALKKNEGNESLVEEVKKHMFKINKELVKDSIDRTQKFIKEKTNNITKKIQKIGENDKVKTDLRKKLEKKGKKKAEFYQIVMEEDLPYEKEIRKINEEKKGNESKIKYQNKMNRAMKIEKEKTVRRENKNFIEDELSFMSDLSLSNSFEKSFTKKTKIYSKKLENELIGNNLDNDKNASFNSKKNEDILLCGKKEIDGFEIDFEEKVNYYKPSSILAPIIKLKNDTEIKKKLKKMQDKFNLKNFLKKEKIRGTNMSKINKRNSFLKFLKYTQKSKSLQEYLLSLKNSGNIDSSFESNNYEENNFDIFSNQEKNSLSDDSYLSINGNISINDIDLIPEELKENKIMTLNPFESDNKNKLIKSNKITRMIRESIFDRTSVNTNIELTTEQQSKYLKKINNNLNKVLFPDNRDPRGRKKDDLDKSHIISSNNYEQILQNNDDYIEDFQTNAKDDSKSDKDKRHSLIKINDSTMNFNIRHFGTKKFAPRFNNNNLNRHASKKLTKMSFGKINESLIESDDSNFYFNIKNSKTRAFDKTTLNGSSFSHINNEKETLENVLKSKSSSFYIFKAKSIEKNMDKYPKENTKDFLVREENKPYKDPLTVKQEGIPDNLRGKKYYLNYLFNISDKDLKVKDTFKVDHWSNEILGIKPKYIKKKPLPESVEAFFVFNDKKLDLKRYKYFYHKDFQYKDEECSFLTHHLKYLPRCILETMPLRIRNFGRFAVGKEVKVGALGNKSSLLSSNISLNKSHVKSFDSRRKTSNGTLRNKSSLVMNSSFSNHYKTQEEVKFKKSLFERAYKKIDELNYRTLSTFFTEEEKFFSKLIDEKRRAEKIRKIEIRNNEKENKLEVKSEILNIKIYDLKTNSSRYVQWSGIDVLRNKNEDDERKKWNKLIKTLEDFNVIIWSNNSIMKKWQKIRYANYILATNIYFDIIVLIVVIINSFFMALDGNLLKPETLDKMNISYYIFNSIFILEYIVKFIGLSPLVYYSDPFTYIDTFIIGLAITDYILPSQVEGEEDAGEQSPLNSRLSFLRVFRIFRILRLAKILRRLKSMRLIIVSMTKAIANVSYIVMILVMFILIFELLAMSLLSKNVHYKSFTEGFYITYQVLTLENWDGLLYELWNMSEFSFIYYAIWIFLGNYIIFNLFTSVLLQAFGEDEKDFDLSEDEIIENMYSLPDYLYNLKKAEQEHTKIISNQKRKALVKELFKADLNEPINNQKNDSSTNIRSSKDLNRSQLENSGKISNHSKKGIEESDEKNADNNEDSSSSDINSDRYYSEIEKSMIKWERINKLFRKNDCENSIYFLSQTNRFRIFCMKLINNKWFEKFIFIMIIFSTARLILDTFLNGYLFSFIFDYIDVFLNIIFLLEAIIKICALGFALDEGSYLRDHWNKIDIIIVICSLLDYEILFEKYVFERGDFSSSDFLKVLRLLRTIRPLRLISHNAKLKLILTSLFDSILPIFNALFIVLIIYFIFSIVGIALFYENYHTCYILRENGIFDLAIASFDDNLVEFKIKNDMKSISDFCAINYNGIMDTGPAFKFSNIGTALITSYVLSTQEGWPDIMNSYRVYGDNYGIFFIIYNLIVAYFFLNLFTGIMFRYFNEAYSKEQKLAPNDKKAPKYLDFLTQIIQSNSHYVTWLRPNKGSFQYYLREFADSNLLNNAIMACIFLNFLVMILNYEGCNANYELALIICNYFFTCVFILECIVKILAYGVEGYFHTKWHRFDFFIVVVSVLDIIFGNVKKIDYKFLQTFQVVRILKVTRILRIFRLIKIIKGLDKVLETLSWSLSALINVLLLMIILYGIFATLGCYFYDDLIYENYKGELYYINEYYNLDNFYYAFLLTFRCTTGENWNNIMMELAYINPNKFSPTYAYMYMIFSNFVNAIIMLNLFLMVTLQQYDEFTNKNYNPIEKYEKFLDEFNNSWNKFSTYEDKGFRIKKGLIINFFMDYNWKKLNFPEEGKLDYIKKYITDLKLKSDDDNYIYYHDVICKIIIEQLGQQVDRANPENALILKTEKKLQEKIKRKIESYIGRKHIKEKGKKNITITYNPLTSHLYYKTSYIYIKTFLDYYKENAEFLHQLEGQQEEQIENSQIPEDIHEGNSASNIALSLKNK